MSPYVVGVDGCRSGWLACRLAIAHASYSFAIYDSFERLLAAEREAAVIAIDIPIGLNDDWTPRACDREARKLLGRQGSSVFPAPPRSLLKEATYAQALEKSRVCFDCGLSKQIFHIFRKIDEVDSAFRVNRQLPVFEVHPEICFRQLKGDHLSHSKKTAEGYEERRSLLEQSGVNLPSSDKWRADLGFHAKQVSRDDVPDAAVAALTARRASQREPVFMPAGPTHDACGIRMQLLLMQ